ncbi:MAG: starvation-inducible outer membrane lipoprotein [Cellvibrionaceae bacterium]|jgi:starvation-inducible outer membrane lipoprotein
MRAIYRKTLLLSLGILVLSACASTPPAQLITQAPSNDITLPEVGQSPSRFIKSPVRWGGRIVKSEELKIAGGTDKAEEKRLLKLEILGYPLDQKGKPVQSAEALGRRFIAKLQQPYKAGRYYRNRWVTIAGEMSGTETYTLPSGENQILPVVDAHEKYAWREEYRDDYYNDYWWPRFYFKYGIGHSRGRSGVGIYVSPWYLKRLR